MVKTPITWDIYPAPAGTEINGHQEAFMYIYVYNCIMTLYVYIIIYIWVCLKMGYTPNYSHLVGIMIINHG